MSPVLVTTCALLTKKCECKYKVKLVHGNSMIFISDALWLHYTIYHTRKDGIIKNSKNFRDISIDFFLFLTFLFYYSNELFIFLESQDTSTCQWTKKAQTPSEFLGFSQSIKIVLCFKSFFTQKKCPCHNH